MAGLKSTESTLVFRGVPQQLLLQNEPPDIKGFDIEPDKKLARYIRSDGRLIRVKTDRSGKLRKLKISLDPVTPPGLYHAILKTDDRQMSIEINVETRPLPVFLPSKLSLTGAPGDKIKSSVQIVNRGNADFDLPDTAAVGVYDNLGIETAFASTYRQDSERFDEPETYA